jgi:hypothetical protein
VREKATPWCKDCYAKTKKLRKRALKKEIEDYKKQQQCKNCGMSDYRCLDFHHTRDKEFSIGIAVSAGIALDKIFEEIAKCDVLCANCHRIVHYEDKKPK